MQSCHMHFLKTLISGAARIGEAIRKTKKTTVWTEELIMVISKGWCSTNTCPLMAKGFILEARKDEISANQKRIILY